MVVPASMVLATGLKTTGLYKYSISFSLRLCTRYLRGFDLEFRDSALSRVQQFINQTGGPRYLPLVGVSTGHAEPVLPAWVSNVARKMMVPFRE